MLATRAFPMAWSAVRPVAWIKAPDSYEGGADRVGQQHGEAEDKGEARGEGRLHLALVLPHALVLRRRVRLRRRVALGRRLLGMKLVAYCPAMVPLIWLPVSDFNPNSYIPRLNC